MVDLVGILTVLIVLGILLKSRASVTNLCA